MKPLNLFSLVLILSYCTSTNSMGMLHGYRKLAKMRQQVTERMPIFKIPINFAVISLLDESEALTFYEETKSSNILKKQIQNETLDIKSEICEAIIESALFRERYQCGKALNLQEDAIYDEVLRDYPNLMEAINRTRFGNAYVPRTTETSQSEDVFSCFAWRKSGSRNLTQYFISREYITKGPIHFENETVPTGRFVFESRDSDEGDLLAAIALAENEEYHNVGVHVPQDDYWQVLLYKNFMTLDKSCYREARCEEITPFNKIRLCAIILKTDILAQHVDFMPDAKNVKRKCTRKIVKFMRGYDYHFRDRIVPDVWMVTCRAKFISNNEPTNVHIVPGAFTDEYYISMQTDEKNVTSLVGVVSHNVNKPKLGLPRLPIMV